MRNREIHVVKFGSSLLTNGDGVNKAAIRGYAEGLAKRHNDDQLIIVTSGAVQAGLQKARWQRTAEEVTRLKEPQLAAIGMAAIFRMWESAFEEQGGLAASVAVTHRQLDKGRWWQRKRRKEYGNFMQFIHDNGQEDVETIVNEADAISVTELIKLHTGGENDGLASHVARSVGATSLTLFKTKGGLIDDQGRLIDEVNSGNIGEVRQMAALRRQSAGGRGGIQAGIDACWAAAEQGIEARIAAINHDMSGQDVTNFVVG